jgi:microcystin degradation protein MlrC
MTRDDIIRLAREAGFVRVVATHEDGAVTTTVAPIKELERFAILVAAKERKRMDLNAIHTCHAECQNPFCVRVREAVEHEREQCAKLCEELENQRINSSSLSGMIFGSSAEECATAIRARGNTGIKWVIEP